MIEHLNQLRENLFLAYTGILTGLQADKMQNLFLQYLQQIIPFIQLTASDQDREDDVVRAAVGLIGDLASTFKVQAAPFLNQPFVAALVLEVKVSPGFAFFILVF